MNKLIFFLEVGSNLKDRSYKIISLDKHAAFKMKFNDNVVNGIAQILTDACLCESKFYNQKNEDLYSTFKIYEDNEKFFCEGMLLCELADTTNDIEIITDDGQYGIYVLVIDEEFDSLDELIERFSPRKRHKFNTFDRISVKLVYLTDDCEIIVGKSKIDNNSNSFNTISIEKQHVVGLFQKIKQTERFKALVDQYKPNSALIFKIDVKATVEFINVDEFKYKTVNAFITVNGVDNKEARFKKLIFDDMNFDSVKDFIEYVSN